MPQRPDADLCLHDVFEEQARSRPHEWAVIESDTRIAYREANERVQRLTTLLLQQGVDAGDRVVWLGQNSFRLLELVMAAGRIGAMVCPANWRQSPDELDFMLRDLDPSIVVAESGQLAESVDHLPSVLTSGIWMFVDEGPEGYEAALARSEPDTAVRHRDPSTPVLIMYTAAHEGRPNGAMMTHQGLIAAGVVHAVINGIFTERPVFLAALPLYHIATFMGCLSTMLLGGTNVYVARPAGVEICRLLAEERCTWAYLTGPIIGQVAQAAEETGADLSAFYTPLAYVNADSRWAKLGKPSTAPWSLHPGAFGQTEMTGIITYAALAVGAVGAAGRPSPWSLVRVVDPDGNEVAAGETGEITARGVTVGAGYWNRPELNERRCRGGWWHTGDLGRREADGSLSFVGPMARMVKSGKENIYPAEVERCLREHPEIADAAVLGVPDAEWEQAVKAVVVLAAGAQLSQEDVITHCRERIASYKKPKFVVFAQQLPRQGGQVDRDELDRQFGGGGYPGVGA
jgi:acyl-CoA synthetase (AMP-forming)/AMP-acid ligase II